MRQHHNLLKEILISGEVQFEPRTQEFILGISGRESRFDLRDGFPIITTKNVNPRLLVEELFWKLRGERSVKSLFDANVHIWDANAFQKYLENNDLAKKIPKHTQAWEDEFESWKERLTEGKEDGDLGPVYGHQWRHWTNKNGEEVDQLKKMVSDIRERPGSRYHILNAYNTGDRAEMALGPCPFWDQFTVYGDQLDLTAVQRSCDTILGVPFNISQEATLLGMVAKETELEARTLKHYTINTHLYLGVPPRSDFWINPENVKEFQGRVGEVTKRAEYKDVRDWYLSETSEESGLNFGKDHIPDALTQLAKRPRGLPTLNLKEGSLYDLIEQPANDVVRLEGYEPHRWKTSAVMAA
ncbi:MAG: thymidylate synthase [Nanoarchaeota archaeon]|nr:thymidylate synthase [Nanoarchaeota archaeon]|tara:strand:- start:859 stop:1926 length:1068 start_codon:yes stop_codon:yes gene_type:complete